MATSLADFLIESAAEEITQEIVVSERIAQSGHKVKIRAISGGEHTDFQNRSMVNRGKKNQSVDTKKMVEHIVLEACLDPDFKDQKAIKAAGVNTPREYMYKVLLAGELQTIATAITTLSGFNQDVEEEVKN